MTKRNLGILAGVVGSALGAWWLNKYRSARHDRRPAAQRNRGTVIFDNTPTASDSGVL